MSETPNNENGEPHGWWIVYSDSAIYPFFKSNYVNGNRVGYCEFGLDKYFHLV